MKNKRLHINQILAGLMLWVFSLALTPWAAIHQHPVEKASCSRHGEICTHKTHIATETHQCIICSVHFEKDFNNVNTFFLVRLPSKAVVKDFILASSSYTALISKDLRGPPLA